MLRQTLYLWKQAPFLRLVLPLIAGILLQWYCSIPLALAWPVLAAAVTGLVVFNLRVTFFQFRYGWLNGIFINTVFISVGMLLCWYAYSLHGQFWINKNYRPKDKITVTLKEPLSEKPNSWKATAVVQQLVRGDSSLPVSGNIILYFSKDIAADQLGYGSQLLFSKPLQPIKNSGNPGSFNYERYTAFQSIGGQIFLRPGDFVLLPAKNFHPLYRFLYACREKVLHTITSYIAGKKEAGMAEALLVGYKDDLDKTMVQSYSNTGVVHVIAISGMHLGLIYWLLALATGPLKKRKHLRRAVPVIVISGLWLFALLAGGGPSILRSAVMFTCIVIGESLERKTFIYNSLAASAFILLCINPFWLWDAGFQLSYTAVLSIVIFMKPIYNWFYFKNKLADTIWKLMAVTLAAQVLTTPVSMYHFHQFPVYFLFTNLLAVPLSGLIVLLEILLCAVTFIPAVAHATGNTIQWLIAAMNHFIEYMERLPFSLWTGMQVNLLQVILLYAVITALACWLTWKNKEALMAGIAGILVFLTIRSSSFITAGSRHQLVVYNTSKHQAIDFICGRNCLFKGDDALPEDRELLRLALAPSRTLYRTSVAGSFENLFCTGPIFCFNNKTIVLADRGFNKNDSQGKIKADLIIISKNAPVQLAGLLQRFQCNQVVLDASNSPSKVNKWKQEAAKLGLHCFSVVDNGAFVMNMD